MTVDTEFFSERLGLNPDVFSSLDNQYITERAFRSILKDAALKLNNVTDSDREQAYVKLKEVYDNLPVAVELPDNWVIDDTRLRPQTVQMDKDPRFSSSGTSTLSGHDDDNDDGDTEPVQVNVKKGPYRSAIDTNKKDFRTVQDIYVTPLKTICNSAYSYLNSKNIPVTSVSMGRMVNLMMFVLCPQAMEKVQSYELNDVDKVLIDWLSYRVEDKVVENIESIDARLKTMEKSLTNLRHEVRSTRVNSQVNTDLVAMLVGDRAGINTFKANSSSFHSIRHYYTDNLKDFVREARDIKAADIRGEDDTQSRSQNFFT